jgi:glucan 1,3-beta-glucosidase
MGVIQTETPYFQAKPNALVPFRPQASLADPTFADCRTDGCRKAWGLRILDSTDVFMYGAGLYSFFEHYEQTCLDTESCQENMLELQRSKNVWLFGLNTKASTNMVTVSPPPPAAAAAAAPHPHSPSTAVDAHRPRRVVPQADNRNAFCSTLALFQTHPAPPQQQQQQHNAHFVSHSRHRGHAPSIIVEISTS